MAQDQWHFVSVIPEYSAGFKIYLLWLCTVPIVAAVKLMRAWIVAPPFRLKAKEHDAVYVRHLKGSSTSLKQWIIWTILAYAILVGTSLQKVCERLPDERQLGIFTVTTVLRDYAQCFAITLWVILFVCVVRGYLLIRLERISN